MKTRHRLVTFIVMVTLLYQDILLAQGCLSPRSGLEGLEGPSQFGAEVYLGFRQVAERGLDGLDPKYEKYIRFNKDSIVKLSEDGNSFFTIDVELIQANILLTVVFFDPSRPPRRYLERMCKTWTEEDGFWILSSSPLPVQPESVRVSKRFGYIRYHLRRISYIIWEKYLKEYSTKDLRYYLLVLPNIAIVLIRGFGIFLKMVFLKRYRDEYINKIIRNILVKNLDDLSISVEEIEDIREDKSNRAVSSFAFIITWIIMNELAPAPLAGAFVLALPIPWPLKIPMVFISGGIIRTIGIIIAKYFIYPDLKISRAIPVALPKWIGIPWSLGRIMASYSYNFSRLIERNRIERFRRLVEGLDPDIKNSVIRKLLRYGSSAKCIRLLREMIDKPEGYPERVPMYRKFIELIEQNTVTLAIDFGAEKISAALIDNNYEVQGDIIKHQVKEAYGMEDVEKGRAFVIEQLRNAITDAVQLAEDKGLILDIAIVTMEGLSSYKRGTIDYSSRFRIVEGVRFREIIEGIMEKSGIKGVRLYIIDEGYAAVFGEKNFGPHEDKSLFYLGLNTTLRAARIGRKGNFISQTEFGYLYKAEINNEEIELNKIAGRRRLADLAERLAKLPENKRIYNDFKDEYRVQGKLGLSILRKALRDGNPFAVKVYETAARLVGAAILEALRDETIKSYDKIVIGGDLDRYGLVDDDLKKMFLNNVLGVVSQGYQQRTHAIVMSGLDNTRELKGAKFYVLTMIEGRGPEELGGAAKDIGPPMDIKIPEEIKRRWREKAKEVKLVKCVHNISAKVFQVDDLPRGLNAWHFRDGEDLVIVTRAPPTDEIIYHEYREDYWMNQKGLSQRDAHILASYEQALLFSEDGGLTPYHQSQIENVDIDEDRRYHHGLIKKHLGKKKLKTFVNYEARMRRRAILGLFKKDRKAVRRFPASEDSKRKLEVRLSRFTPEEWKELFKKAGELEGREIKDGADLRRILAGWLTVEQLAKILDRDLSIMFERIKDGHIRAFISVGRNKRFHPIKAIEEYIYFEENKSLFVAKKRLRTKIKKLSRDRLNRLSEFVKEETGVTAKTTEEVFSVCKDWFNIDTLAMHLGLAQEVVWRFISQYGLRTFMVGVRNRNPVILISPRGVKRIEAEIRGFLDRIEAWYRENFSVDLKIGTIDDIRNWCGIRDLEEIFPFLPIEYLIKIRKLRAYIVKGTRYVPPIEVERLRDIVLSRIRSPKVFEILKKYGLIPSDMLPEQIDYEKARDIIMYIEGKWLTIPEFVKRSEQGETRVRNLIEKDKIDHVLIKFLISEGNCYIPPECLKNPVIDDIEALEVGRRFLEQGCGVTVPSMDEVRELLTKHCMTASQMKRQLGLSPLLAFVKRPNTVKIKFADESVPNIYWRRQDAEEFIRGEEKKFQDAIEQVSLYSDVSHIKTIKELVDFLNTNWKPIKLLCKELGVAYSTMQKAIYRGEISAVRINFAGYIKQTFLPPGTNGIRNMQQADFERNVRRLENIFEGVFSQSLIKMPLGLLYGRIGHLRTILARYIEFGVLKITGIRKPLTSEEEKGIRKWGESLKVYLVHRIAKKLYLEGKGDMRSLVHRLTSVIEEIDKKIKGLKDDSKEKEQYEELRDILGRIIRIYQTILVVRHQLQKFNTPRDYQLFSIARIVEEGRVLLADDTRLGKSYEALMGSVCVNSGTGANKTIIVCNNSAIGMWRDEIIQHLGPDTGYVVISGESIKTKLRQFKEARSSRSRYVIMNFNTFTRYVDEVKGLKADYAVIDEAHHIGKVKGRHLLRDAVFQLGARYKILISATPIRNKHPEEVWPLLHWLYPEEIGRYSEFRREFGNGNYSFVKLKVFLWNAMVRFTKEEVDNGGARHRMVTRLISMTKPQAEAYKRMLKDFAGWCEEHFGDGKDKRPGRSVLRKLFRLREAACIMRQGPGFSNKITELIKVLVSEADCHKYDPNKQNLLDLMPRDERVVIFTESLAVLNAVRSLDPRIKYIYEKTSRELRDKLKDEFNEGSGPQVLAATRGTMGESVGLWGATKVIEMDLPYTVRQRKQSVDRVLGHKQKLEEVPVIYIASKGTIDEDLIRFLDIKQTIIDAFMDEGELDIRIVIDRVLSKVRILDEEEPAEKSRKKRLSRTNSDWGKVEEAVGVQGIRYMDDPYIGMKRGLTKEEEVRLIRLYRDEDNGAAFDLLVKSNIRWIYKIVNQMIRRNPRLRVEKNDLVQEGTAGFMHAIDLFDIGRGFTIKTYATYWIEKYIQRYLQNNSRVVRLPVYIQEWMNRLYNVEVRYLLKYGELPKGYADIIKFDPALDMTEKQYDRLVKIRRDAFRSLDEPIGDEDSRPLHEIIGEEGESSSSELFNILDRAIDEFYREIKAGDKGRVVRVISLRVGYDFEKREIREPLTLEEIGKQLGITRQGTKQIEKKYLPIFRRILVGLGVSPNFAGASKDIGPPLDIKIPEEIKRRWGEKAKGVNLKVYTPGDSNISAKVFQVDDLPKGLNAWHFRDGEDLVIVTRAPLSDEIIYHEFREDYWMSLGLSQRDAHILASAEEVLAFSEGGRPTAYHNSQLENMTINQVQDLIEEYNSGRVYHYQLIKKYLGLHISQRIEMYESLLINKLRFKCVEEMLRKDSSGWPNRDVDVVDVLLKILGSYSREDVIKAAITLRRIDIDWDKYPEKKEEVVRALKKYNEPVLRFTEIFIRGYEYWRGLGNDEKIAYLKGVTGDLYYLIYVLFNYFDKERMDVWIKKLWRIGRKEDLKKLLDAISPEEYQMLGEEILGLVKSEYDFKRRYIDSFVPEEERAVTAYFLRLLNLLREFRVVSDGIPLVVVYNDSFNLPFEMLSSEERGELGLVIMDEEELRDILASEDGRDRVKDKIIAVKMAYPERKEKEFRDFSIFSLKKVRFTYEDTDAFFNKLRDIFKFCSIVLVDRDDEFKISVLQRKLKKSLFEEVTGRDYEFSERTNFMDKRFGGKKIAMPQWFFVNFLETAFLSNEAKSSREVSPYGIFGVLTINRDGEVVNLNDFLKEKILRAICGDIREKLIFWPDFTTDKATNWLLKIPRYLRLPEMSDTLRRFLLDPQKDFLRKNINIVYGRDVADQEIQNIYITHYQGGAYQIILRVTVQLINGEQRDFGMVLARDGQEKSDLTKRDFYNLGELYARDSRFVPRPYMLDEIGIRGEKRAVFSVEWLSEFKELGYYGRGFSINSYGENRHFSEEEGNRIKEEMIRILAAYYDSEKRRMIDKIEINSGDFVYDMEERAGNNVRLITVRNIKEGVSPEEFIDYIVNFEQPADLFFISRFLSWDNINNLINGLIRVKGLETALEWLIAYRDAVVAGRLKENRHNGIKQFDNAIEVLSRQKSEGQMLLEDIVKRSRELAGEWSKLGGVVQDTHGISILQFAVPIGVLKSAGDFTLALKKMGLLGRGDTIFELIIYDLEDELDGDRFIKALDLPRNIRVYGITKAQAGDIGLLKDFIRRRYPLREDQDGYLMIATDFVDSDAVKDVEARLQSNLEEKVSLRVIVRPDETSVISLSNILSSWLEDLDSSVKIILPLPISPQELKRRLEEEMLYLWEFLVST